MECEWKRKSELSVHSEYRLPSLLAAKVRNEMLDDSRYEGIEDEGESETC